MRKKHVALVSQNGGSPVVWQRETNRKTLATLEEQHPILQSWLLQVIKFASAFRGHLLLHESTHIRLRFFLRVSKAMEA